MRIVGPSLVKALVVTGSHSAFKNGAYKDLEEVAHTKGVDLVLLRKWKKTLRWIQL